MLKQHIYDRLKVNINPSKDHQLSFVNDKTRTEQFSSIKSSSIEINCSLSSSFFIAMARKIIKSPSNFRGAKDDVIEWLEKIEQRFTIPDDQKTSLFSRQVGPPSLVFFSKSPST
ncbi:unnamed protein product [Rotaria socialis]|uniref:Uncharacterized protein n=1 Tax=Rotaria socialis TaxID=392032 RepID=A0A821HUZ0_9BILA|nr:unnamed protein product [Rotaria socialis]